jgi:flavodoxin
MHSLVIYATTSGNTRLVAESMAEALSARGPVDIHAVDDLAGHLQEADLVLLGGPTEGHAMTRSMARMLDRLPAAAWQGRTVAAFDTRLRWPRFLSGSAAVDIAARVSSAGARVIAEPESFMVSMQPRLEPGEVERAATWALQVADAAIAVPVGT